MSLLYSSAFSRESSDYHLEHTEVVTSESLEGSLKTLSVAAASTEDVSPAEPAGQVGGGLVSRALGLLARSPACRGRPYWLEGTPAP